LEFGRMTRFKKSRTIAGQNMICSGRTKHMETALCKNTEIRAPRVYSFAADCECLYYCSPNKNVNFRRHTE